MPLSVGSLLTLPRETMAAEITTIDACIAAQPEAAQTALRKVRAAIRKGIPDAREAISYKIAAYNLHGRFVLYFAGWKKHYSLYPTSAAMVEAFRKELAPYQVEKGTIRFPMSAPVPAKLVERLARFRAGEAASAVAKPKAARGGRRSAASPAPGRRNEP